MKTKVICGRTPYIKEGKTRKNSWGDKPGALVRPTGRRSLILNALELIARKVRAKE
jgi:hypothetical protein